MMKTEWKIMNHGKSGIKSIKALKIVLVTLQIIRAWPNGTPRIRYIFFPAGSVFQPGIGPAAKAWPKNGAFRMA